MFHGYRVSVWGDEDILETDDGAGWPTMWTHLMPLNSTLKTEQNGKFYVMYILPMVRQLKINKYTRVYTDICKIMNK